MHFSYFTSMFKIIWSSFTLSLFFEDWYSLHINCGGERTSIGDIAYEADEDLVGPAKFVPLSDNWGFSSTGDFWDHNGTTNDYITQNVSMLRMNDSQLYTSTTFSSIFHLLWTLLGTWGLYCETSFCRDSGQRQ